MAQFLITYDLHNRRDYQPLYEALHRFKAVRLCESVWLATLLGPAETVRNLLMASIDHDDSLAVIELKPGSDWATVRVKPDGANWLSAFITARQAA
jgi:hypothetical protein